MRALPPIATLLLTLLLAMWISWPAVIDPSVVVGHPNHPDCLSNHWLLVWVAEGLLHGRDLLHNTEYYWPVGDYPLLAGNGSEGFLYLPFHLIWGWPQGAGAYVLALLTANGLAGWWAARRAGASPWGAMVGAAALTSSSYALQELGSGRFSQGDLVWLVLALGWWMGATRDLRAGRPVAWWRGLGGGALWGVATALYWYHGWFAFLTVLILAVPHLWVCRRVPWGAAGAWLAAAAAVVAWPLSWFLRHWHLIPGTDELASFPHREAVGDAVSWTLPLFVHGGHQGMALSAVVLALAAWQVVRAVRGREREGVTDLSLVLVVLVALLLARGPYLAGGVPGPYWLAYGWSEVLQRFWWPSRHLVLVHWAMALLAARGASAVLASLRSGRLRIPAALALAATVPLAVHLVGDLSRLPMARYEEPAFYRSLAALPEGAVAEVPLSPRLSGSQQMLVYQLTHHRPLLLGHAMWVDRVRPDAWDELVADNSFLSAWMTWEEGRSESIRFEGEDLLELRDLGLRWMVHNRELVPMYMHDAYHEALLALFGYPVIGESRAKAFDMNAWTGRTHIQPGRPRLSRGSRLANGLQPFMGLRPHPLGFWLLRDTSKPLAGLTPGEP